MSYFIEKLEKDLIGQTVVHNGKSFTIMWTIPKSWPTFLPIGKLLKIENETFLFSSVSPEGREDFSILDMECATCFVHFGSMRGSFDDKMMEFQNAREGGDILVMRLALDDEQKREKTSYHSAKTMRVTDIDGDTLRFVREHIKEAMINAAYEVFKEQSVVLEKEAAKKYAIEDVEVISEQQDGDQTILKFSEGISLDSFYDYVELVLGERAKDICDILETEDGKKWTYVHKI